MSKFLVDRASGSIRSTHDHPMNFSVSGKYVIDVPSDLQIRAESDVVAELLAEKVSRIQALHPSLPNAISDELLAAPLVDTGLGMSSRYVTGPDKRTVILPGGVVWTTAIAVGASFSNVFARWYGFTLHSDPTASGVYGPDPSPLLYNYNPVSAQFEEFVSSQFQVDLYDDAGLTFISNLSGGVEQAASFTGPGSIRLRFENLDPDRIWHLSDWLLLHD